MRRSSVEIKRYINGKPVSQEELAKLKVLTPELEHAVKDARRRAEAVMRAENLSPGTAVSETRADG